MIKSAMNLYIQNESTIKWSFQKIPCYSSWATRSGCALIKIFKKNSKFDVQTSISSEETISSKLQLTEMESIAKVEVGPKIELDSSKGESTEVLDINNAMNWANSIIDTIISLSPKH